MGRTKTLVFETLVPRVAYEEMRRGKTQKVYLPDFMVYFKVPLIGAT